jgi:quercetin dioxygenase-like cupin family protein
MVCAMVDDDDPVTTNPDHYRTIFENEHVRVLDYLDRPGESTTPHVHPNSVMITLTDFQRRLTTGGGARDVELPANRALWLPAQRHAGENIGSTPTHTILVELKGDAAGEVDEHLIGPAAT